MASAYRFWLFKHYNICPICFVSIPLLMISSLYLFHFLFFLYHAIFLFKCLKCIWLDCCIFLMVALILHLQHIGFLFLFLILIFCFLEFSSLKIWITSTPHHYYFWKFIDYPENHPQSSILHCHSNISIFYQYNNDEEASLWAHWLGKVCFFLFLNVYFLTFHYTN